MKLMAIDGNSIINRAYYGIRQLTTRDGTPTNGVYGFLTILQKLLADEMPDALCVTFDLPGPTFRHEQYDAYKAHRTGMPDDLAVQMPVMKDVLRAMNVPIYELAGWEADDLIGTISRGCEAAGWDCVIVTGDKDSFQLVTDKTRVKHVKSRMGQTETKDYTVPVFTEEYGFEPVKIVDLKALMGDSSDNIPGVAGVGEKTALDLVRRFGSVDDIFAALDTLDIKDSVRKKLDAGRENAAMSYDLATIRTDAPIEFAPENATRREVDNDALYDLFRRLEFAKLTERFGLTPPGSTAAKSAAFEPETITIVSASDADSMFTRIKNAEACAVRADLDLGIIVLVSRTEDAAFIVTRADAENYSGIAAQIFSAEISKAGHEVKDTMRALISAVHSTGGWVFDTALAAYLISPTDNSYELARLTDSYCGYSITAGMEENGQMSLLGGEDIVTAMLKEAVAVALLREVLTAELEALSLTKLYFDIELPLCAVLAEMEAAGFLVDRAALTEFGEMLSAKIEAAEQQIYEQAGETFNIGSPKQLGVILFEKLMLPAPKRTKTGYSTNIEVLDYLADKHPVINLIKEYRELTKLKSTYADGLVKVTDSAGRIHTRFQMTVTATGRLSSTEPNLQNIPIRKELGGEIRKMFVAAPGNLLVDADYSQIELRLLAHIAGDEIMLAAFKSGEDIHTVTASQVFGVPVAEVTSIQRSRAKAVNFGIVYGISAFSLAQDIGVTVSEAKMYIDNYLEKYSGVARYMADVVTKAKADGFVVTLFGRRRALPEISASNFNVRSFGERVALNMPIQGTAADIMKLAMINVAKRIKTEKLAARLILQVHDELIIECPENEAEAVSSLLREEMEGAASLSVPLTAETHAGRSWYDTK